MEKRSGVSDWRHRSSVGGASDRGGYGSSAATGMGVAGTPIGATELGGVKRSTDMYRQP